jgi:hypothetical protein
MKSVLNKIKSFDGFGHQIGLSYKGESTFKTLLGGICTIVGRVIIVLAILIELRQIVDQEYDLKKYEMINDVEFAP